MSFKEESLYSQVWSIDKAGALVIRTDITLNEPVGRKWKFLKAPPGLSREDFGGSNEGLFLFATAFQVCNRIDI